MTFNKLDLKRIGHTAYGRPENGKQFAAFVCLPATANIEYLILRDILKLYGYEITDERDIILDNINTVADIELLTNMPWDEYRKLVDTTP